MADTPRTSVKAEPIPRTTLTTAVFEQLISYVVKGEWKAGHQIPPERELCQQLGIARTSLREVLKAMELVGMLESRVGDGTFVCPRSEFLSRPLLWAFTGTDEMELRDIMEARALLEIDLAGLAAERGSQGDIEKIRDAVEELRQAIADGGPLLQADLRFHVAVGQAAHNEVLANAVGLLRNLLRQLLLLKLNIPSVPAQALSRHEAIYKAIRNHDVTSARRAMLQHMDESATHVNEVVQDGFGRERSGRRRQK